MPARQGENGSRPVCRSHVRRKREQRQAFGVDPSRPHFYSLRQSRYDAAAADLDAWAAAAAAAGRRLSILDVGCGWGILLRYLEVRPHFPAMVISATELADAFVYRKEAYHQFYTGDLAAGYPAIPTGSYDVVVCEQVLEHLDAVDAGLRTLVRLVKPGGRLIIGVPIFIPPLHLVRQHVVPLVCGRYGMRTLGSHRQAFSLCSFRRKLDDYPQLAVLRVRGFRIVSGGPLRPLENFRWWWRLNRRLGELIPAACIEVQLVLGKNARPGANRHLPLATGDPGDTEERPATTLCFVPEPICIGYSIG
jgi:2-polyprenyl-3-methyl-5-hydroxy-6-metoxy-1,4-benzoquinol methylase